MSLGPRFFALPLHPTALAAAFVLTALVPDALADQARERVLWNLNPDHWLPGVAPAATLAAPYFLFVHALLLIERYRPWHVALNWAWIGCRGEGVFLNVVPIDLPEPAR